MSRAWKWILGIVALLVVVGLAAGAVFMWQNHAGWWGRGGFTFSAPGSPQGPGVPYGPDGYRRYHMDDWAWRMPMMHGGGYVGPLGLSPFGMGFMLVAGLTRLILPLGVLALVAYLFYQMGKRAGSAAATPAPSRPDVNSLPARKVARR